LPLRPDTNLRGETFVWLTAQTMHSDAPQSVHGRFREEGANPHREERRKLKWIRFCAAFRTRPLEAGQGRRSALWPKKRRGRSEELRHRVDRGQQPRWIKTASNRPPHSCMISERGGRGPVVGTTVTCPEKHRSVSNRARVAWPRPGTSKMLCQWCRSA